MRQKVVIRAIVSRKNRILLLRRHGGRPSIAGLYELPGGSLHTKEQPTDALKRSLQIHAGVEPETFRLRDVASFIDPDDRELQYLFILYEVTIEDSARVTLDDEYDRYVWRNFREIQPNEITNSTAILLGIGADGLRENDDFLYDEVPPEVDVENITTNSRNQDKDNSHNLNSSNSRNVKFTTNSQNSGDQVVDNSTTASRKSDTQDSLKNPNPPDIAIAKNTTVIVHSDGGSRGNPGPTAAAYIIASQNGEILAQGGEYLGDTFASDLAEYYGVLFGLRAAARLGARNINFYSDSLMVVNQLNGLFSPKERDEKVFRDIKKILFKFDRVHFRHVHREYNRLADGLVNKILDENEDN